ncbi:MAG TPA: peroxiredoxin [Steroidobacteraceae bacterium]|nr:peroxiredoxin [Steroidobacteraceae bacterium]HNS26878.1 peroxiredoxin [Steroidobacteraceae bacterium]
MLPDRSTLLAAILAMAAVAMPALAQDSPAVGSAAPTFKLQDQNGAWRTLEEQRGKWVVLYFYPKDNTPGCTTQACEFRDNIFAFREAGAVIYGISVDDVKSHEEFAREHSLPFTILADSAKETAKSYGVLYKAMGLLELARRDTFIIDPQGRIAKHYVKVDPKGHSELVLADIKALQAAAKG